MWSGCSATSCGPYPTGSWQRRDVVRSLSIQQAEGNPPPAALADVPRDVNPTENNQVVRAFMPTGSRSTNCLATRNEMANSANPFGIVLFCGARQPAGLGGVPGVLVSVFFPQPVSPAGFVLSVTLYQQGAGTYGPPALCTAADGCWRLSPESRTARN